MSRIDYSKWDHIEISDDEDDTHPNVDTGSLFRWRHQARVERMKEQDQEKQKLEEERHRNAQKAEDIKRKLKEADAKQMADQVEKLKLEMTDVEKQQEEYKKKEAELRHKEKMTPLNIDTICHDGKSKTLINKSTPRKKEILTDEERAERQRVHEEKHKQKMKQFGMFQKYDDSLTFLTDNPELVAEETANFLVIWCIDLEVEEKHSLMAHVAHQTITMQFILELAKSLDVDPRGCVKQFFNRIKMGEKQYMDAFNDELESFKERIRGRAKARIERYMKEIEEEEKQKRIGPGGLDPADVFESLPDDLKQCFESRDIALLQETIAKMPEEQARYHIKRCVDSGLWVPNAADMPDLGDDETYESVEDDVVSEQPSKPV